MMLETGACKLARGLTEARGTRVCAYQCICLGQARWTEKKNRPLVQGSTGLEPK